MHKKSIRKVAQLHGWWLHKTFLKRTARYSEEQRRAWIDAHLKQTLVRAYEGTVYYRETFRKAGFDPRSDRCDPATLKSLPLLTKEMVRERWADMIDHRHKRFAAWAETSGTTGQPMRMLLNEGYIALDYACMYAMWTQAGYRFRDRFLALRSYVPSKEGDPLWRHDAAQNTLFMSAYHLSAANVDEYLRQIRAFRPKFIRGYPSSLAVLAGHLQRRGERPEGVQGLFTASETLADHERRVIEDVFGKRLFDWYGMTEPAVVAYEGQQHDGLGIVWQYGVPELIADETQAEGARRLVTTSLHNPAMPFIRYDTGDVVTPHPDDGGSSYPRKLLRVSGRKDEVIVTPDGRRLPSVNFYSVFRDAPGVGRFQIVQYGTADVAVNMESGDPRFATSASFRRLKNELRSRFGGEMTVEYRINRHFETNRDGKTPVVLRRMANRAVEEKRAYELSTQTAWSRSLDGESILKLDWNEADRLPSGKVREKLAALLQDERALVWYPEARPATLVNALADYAGVPGSCISVTHGSDVALAALVSCYLARGDRALLVTPGYDQFRAQVEQQGAEALSFEFAAHGDFPTGEFLERMRRECPRLIYLSNPNNPLGCLLPQKTIESICEQAREVSALVVIDEAYFEFARESSAALISRFANLAVIRTFSKAFGLAGLRIGYLIADSGIIQTVERVINPKSLTTFARVAAETALAQRHEMRAYVDEVIFQRGRLLSWLREREVECFDSHANFILIKVADPAGMVRWFEVRGVLLRDRSAHLKNTVRITIGGAQSMERTLCLLEEWMGAETEPDSEAMCEA
jgi:histidinol-phosphate aminotransferase